MVLSKEGAGAFNREIIRWGVDGKRFTISDGTNTLTGNYKVSGYILTIAYPEGDAIWVRKDKAEGFKKKIAAEERKEAERSRVADNRSADNVAREVSGGGGQDADILTDSRDGQVYRTVKMPDGKTWMAQNLNFKTGSGSWCYDDNADNCKRYGRLYDWRTAKKACPAGWHLPDTAECYRLMQNIGGKQERICDADVCVTWFKNTDKKLKSKIGWNTNQQGKIGTGTDDYGFSALPGGLRSSEISFRDAGDDGYWWTASDLHVVIEDINSDGDLIDIAASGNNGARVQNIKSHSDDGFVYTIDILKTEGLSVRCVKDE
jgi:uncharacterized protein (TIGR02145 family)